MDGTMVVRLDVWTAFQTAGMLGGAKVCCWVDWTDVSWAGWLALERVYRWGWLLECKLECKLERRSV